MLNDIESRLSTPPKEGNARAVELDINSWWNSGGRVAGHLDKTPQEQLEAWADMSGIKTEFDQRRGVVTFVRYYGTPS